MKNQKTPLALALSFALSPCLSIAAETASQLDELVVEGESTQAPTTHYTSPTTRITDIEAESISVTTVEDFVKYEPSMVVRKRYVGDSNGVVGMRGTNMFQTARTMIYADGLPLHYLLETQWNGSPRWSLVSSDETQAVEVVYGPFSAEYSGNAMGGVINIETKLPQKREFHAEGSIFGQEFEHMGHDYDTSGHREFFSYGDKLGDLSLYLFHNHLENESQPMKFLSNKIKGAGAGTVVTGGNKDVNRTSTDAIYYGDSGEEEVTTDLTKLKLGYEFGDWLAKLTIAYEHREKETSPKTWLTDAAGTPIWSTITGNGILNGDRFSIGGWGGSNPFGESKQNRETLLVGGGVEGPMKGTNWSLSADFSYFEVLEDETRSGALNPADPTYTSNGSVKEFGDTGWITLDLKAKTDRFLNRDDMNFVAGYHYNHYSLEIHSYDSSNYKSGEKTTRTTSTGGDTIMHAAFAQWGWNFTPEWDVALGARYEHWEMEDGFYYRWGGDMEDYKDRDEDGFSPKFSLGFTPEGAWKYRYSLAKAYRFPIVEELYKNEERIDGTSIADSSLEPEVGIHHNLMIERAIPDGFVRVNLFHETVDDVIFNQTDVTVFPTVSTFLPVDEVETSGVEFILQQTSMFDSNIDIRFNVAYTESEIEKNDRNPSTEGNDFPRMPDWRSNLLLTYHVNSMWDLSTGVRYAADSYGQLDNSDNKDNVYGAQDSYTFVDLKVNFRPTQDSRIGFGIDNVTNEEAFVAHPWPQRSVYLEGSIDF